MNMHLPALLLSVAASWSAMAATPVIVTRCGASAGHSYFYPGGLLPAKDTGWQRDAISSGQTLLMRDDNGKYDIVFSDATGRTISSREDGGQVVVVNDDSNRIVLIVNYPEMNVETWMFVLSAQGAGTVTYSQARYGNAAIVKKHNLLLATCRR